MAANSEKEAVKVSAALSRAMDAYVHRHASRFHMPGHKGRLPWLNELAARATLAEYDITEVYGCDALYAADSVIAETERAYAELYKSGATLLSAGGSTLCIQAMLALAMRPRQKLICGRGCHTAAINAMAMLDIDPEWIFPEPDETTGLAKAVTAKEVEDALARNPGSSAVYLTSPDYYGAICDVEAISKVCNKYGAVLLIDNAHGAHLRFWESSRHPINLGADMVCDSLHKTLPVLTGGAALHLKDGALRPDAKRCMSLFGSTSPNYLILLSIDKALESLTADFPKRLERAAREIAQLEAMAKDAGFLVPAYARDPLRMTLGFSSMGYESSEFARLIRENSIEPEMIAEHFAVFMASPHNSPEDFERLGQFITELPRKESLPVKIYKPVQPFRALRPREATLAYSEEIPLDKAVGRISAAVVAACPPGIPLTVPGEQIDEKLVPYLKNYGISRLNVLKC